MVPHNRTLRVFGRYFANIALHPHPLFDRMTRRVHSLPAAERLNASQQHILDPGFVEALTITKEMVKQRNLALLK
ncbi:hypothetical protein ACU063_24300 [Paenibacillus sp. M.A.Huq-81]